ncbi:unnamed protein product [Schistosoma margrebowiei]|uniref:Uncharacterized protein n=1 Tax=Schistosoma margrebowiei TaxID=48269 RepID=A0A183LAE3_9TREM|nr:unnamed protein product [Schistosoma margrebowiei]
MGSSILREQMANEPIVGHRLPWDCISSRCSTALWIRPSGRRLGTYHAHLNNPYQEFFVEAYQLIATRQFSLLEQGDFIQHVMDLLDSHLNESCSQILNSRLSGMSKTTLRDSSTQYEQPQILQRLGVHLLHICQQVKIMTGWDTFSMIALIVLQIFRSIQ